MSSWAWRFTDGDMIWKDGSCSWALALDIASLVISSPELSIWAWLSANQDIILDFRYPGRRAKRSTVLLCWLPKESFGAAWFSTDDYIWLDFFNPDIRTCCEAFPVIIIPDLSRLTRIFAIPFTFGKEL
jgi:hypothetical protein